MCPTRKLLLITTIVTSLGFAALSLHKQSSLSPHGVALLSTWGLHISESSSGSHMSLQNDNTSVRLRSFDSAQQYPLCALRDLLETSWCVPYKSIVLYTRLTSKLSPRTMSRTPKEIKDALDAVRDSDSPDQRHVRIVEDELQKLWKRIQGNPHSYVMSDIEFAIFNRYRNREAFRNSTGQRAVERYWANRRT